MSVDPTGDGLVAAVPEYVHYVVLELLKNAMRATMQAHGAGKAVGGGEGGGGGGGGSGSGGGAGTGMDVAGEENARVQGREEAEGGSRNAGGAADIVFADVPEVVISVRAHGDDDVMLVVADQGGGIPAEATDKVSLCMPRVWPAPRGVCWLVLPSSSFEFCFAAALLSIALPPRHLCPLLSLRHMAHSLLPVSLILLNSVSRSAAF